MSTTTTELTQEEKRIKIAEACGWRYFDDPCTRITWLYGPNNRMRPKAELLKDSPAAGRQIFIADEFSLPNYFEDLNACHEMENAITAPHTLPLYHYSLMETCNPDADRLAKDWTPEQYGAAMQASATQRATAFGKALNLWP